MLKGFCSCKKEYSFEGIPINSIIPLPDTSIVLADNFPQCLECSATTDLTLETWRFNYKNALLCGKVTGAVITPERNGFTFFGPSTCSGDTGLILTVFLDNIALNRDQAGITTNNVVLEYYDNITPSDVLLSKQHSISLTIENYDHTTGIAKGIFQGSAQTGNNTLMPVLNGKFITKFKL